MAQAGWRESEADGTAHESREGNTPYSDDDVDDTDVPHLPPHTLYALAEHAITLIELAVSLANDPLRRNNVHYTATVYLAITIADLTTVAIPRIDARNAAMYNDSSSA